MVQITWLESYTPSIFVHILYYREISQQLWLRAGTMFFHNKRFHFPKQKMSIVLPYNYHIITPSWHCSYMYVYITNLHHQMLPGPPSFHQTLHQDGQCQSCWWPQSVVCWQTMAWCYWTTPVVHVKYVHTALIYLLYKEQLNEDGPGLW